MIICLSVYQSIAIRFTKWWPGWMEDNKQPPSVGTRPRCIVMKRKFPCHERPDSICVADYFFWDAEDCASSNKGHSFICKRPYDDIGANFILWSALFYHNWLLYPHWYFISKNERKFPLHFHLKRILAILWKFEKNTKKFKRMYIHLFSGCIYGKGSQYAGNASITASGKDCLSWGDEKVAYPLEINVSSRITYIFPLFF